MSWAKVDDQWHTHPKVLACSLTARGLWTTALSWSCAHRTDTVPEHVVTFLAGADVTDEADELVRAGLWDEVDGGWVIHDWAEFQDRSLSEQRAEAGRKGGKRSGESRRSNTKQGDEANGEQTKQENEANGEAGTHPDPSRPDDPPGDGVTPAPALEAVADPPSRADRLVAGYVLDYRSTHGGRDPTSAWKGQAGRCVKSLLADGEDPDVLAACLGAIAKENKSPTALPHVVADYWSQAS